MEGLIDREDMRKHPMMQPLFDENNEEHIKHVRRAALVDLLLKDVEADVKTVSDNLPTTLARSMTKRLERENEQLGKMFVSFDPSKEPGIVFENSELKFVHSNIDEKEFEEFKEHQRNNPLNHLWLDLAIAEEKYKAERRRLWIRGIIESSLNKLGKNPTDELLDAATEFCQKNCMLPTLNPTRNHWFLDMLCCFCDGKPYKYNGSKVELKYKQ